MHSPITPEVSVKINWPNAENNFVHIKMGASHESWSETERSVLLTLGLTAPNSLGPIYCNDNTPQM